MGSDVAVVVTVRNEADRLGATLAALAAAFPEARLMVADDGSTDTTADVAARGGAEVVRTHRPLGKGDAATIAVRRILGSGPDPPTLVLCDGDLGASARLLTGLADALERGDGDLAVAVFTRRLGGGFGVALSFARRVVRRLTGLEPAAPISGQRALRPEVVPAVIPFAPGFGMEIGMTVDAHRAGFRLVEVELDLEHRATGRSPGGFVHRTRQLLDFARVYRSRRL